MNEETKYLFELDNVQPRAAYQFKQPLNLRMGSKDNWIVFGNNASGKTFLVRTIMSSFMLSQGSIKYDFSPKESKKVSENILYVTFHDQYGDQADGAFYQLRWNQGLLDNTQPRVKDTFEGKDIKNAALYNILDKKLKIGDLLDKYVISLSSGEFRRFQIARIILQDPRLLIIENPFIGLDEENRKEVAGFLKEVMKSLPIQIIMVLSRIPQSMEGFTHLIYMENGAVQKFSLNGDFDLSQFEKNTLPSSTICKLDSKFQALEKNMEKEANKTEDLVLKLNKVTIKYGERTILKNQDWEIHRGEKWALQGKNGSGKSTLLSIVCADNPQSYSCDVTLFGHKRGSGESIWDIKKHIGYQSPEMYRSYRKPFPVENIVASGLYDTIGLYKKLKDEDFKKIDFWLEVFGLSHLRKSNYLHLSNGEQRMILLARAFVKNPDLLILDEPFHGIDAENRLLARQIIEKFCALPNKTLIMVSHYNEDFPSCISNKLTLSKH